MKFDAVLFDLFDTLVIFDRERLPMLDVNGRQVRSTAGLLHAILRDHAPDVTLGACYDALIWSWQDAERRRAIDHREVAAPERFGRWLTRLQIDPSTCPGDLVTTLLEAHRRELSKAAEFPVHHATMLKRLADARVRLAVVSNFDYTPTAIGILESAGVMDLFDIVVVSDEVGWRKPKADIFDVALRHLGMPASRALFVGDRADIDVVGAHGVGMPVAWINRDRAPLPAGIAPPEFEITDLSELLPIVL